MPETLAPFAHHYVVRGGKTQTLEGEPPKSIVIIAFDSAGKAREWYDSPAYQAAGNKEPPVYRRRIRAAVTVHDTASHALQWSAQ